MQEINRLNVGRTAKEIYPRAPFLALNAYDLLKCNSAFSEALALPPAGGRVVFRVNDAQQVFLALTADERGFFIRCEVSGIANISSKLAGRWLRGFLGLNARQSYRIQVEGVADTTGRAWRLLDPKPFHDTPPDAPTPEQPL